MGSIIFLSAALGWCGTPFPGWWRFIKYPRGPEPDPWRFGSDPMLGIIGIVGGLAAGIGIHYLLPSEGLTTIGLFAFAGGRVLSDITGSFVSK